MTTRECVDSVLRLFEIISAWPVMLVLLLAIYRSQVSALISSLASRLSKAEIAGSKFEFHAVEAFKGAVAVGAEEFGNEPVRFQEFVSEQIDKLPSYVPGDILRRLPRPISVLWVTDDRLNAAYEAELLARYGASVRFAASIDEALSGLVRYELVIADVREIGDAPFTQTAGYQFLKRYEPPSFHERNVFLYASRVSAIPENERAKTLGEAGSPGQLMQRIYLIYAA